MSKIYLKRKTLPVLFLIFTIPVIFSFILFLFLKNSEKEIPPIVIGVNICSHCGMLISDIRFAAVVRVNLDEIHYYDDLGCLFNHSYKSKDLPREGWVHDFKTRNKVSLKKARFIKTKYQTPMGSGWTAQDPLGIKSQQGFNFHEILQK